MAIVEYTNTEVRNVAYALYVRDWMNSHDEGMPVCFNEFVENEYMECFDYIRDLFRAEGLSDWIESYDLDY